VLGGDGECSFLLVITHLYIRIPLRAFLLQVPITIIAFTAVSFALHLPAPQQAETSRYAKFRRIDSLGAISLVSAVFTLLFGLDRGSNLSWSSPLCYGSFIASLILSLTFAYVETTPSLAKEPFAPKRIILNSSLLGAYLTNFFAFAAPMCAIFHVSLYAQAVKGKSASGTGAILLPAICAGVSGSLRARIIMQKTGKYKRLTAVSLVFMVWGTSLIDVMTAASKPYSLTGVASGEFEFHEP